MESSDSYILGIRAGLIATPCVAPTITERVLLEDVKVFEPAVYIYIHRIVVHRPHAGSARDSQGDGCCVTDPPGLIVPTLNRTGLPDELTVPEVVVDDTYVSPVSMSDILATHCNHVSVLRERECVHYVLAGTWTSVIDCEA